MNEGRTSRNRRRDKSVRGDSSSGIKAVVNLTGGFEPKSGITTAKAKYLDCVTLTSASPIASGNQESAILFLNEKRCVRWLKKVACAKEKLGRDDPAYENSSPRTLPSKLALFFLQRSQSLADG